MKAALLCEAAWGKCDRGSAVPLERLGKVRFLLFPMFHPILLQFFCPALQSLTLIVRGKLGWRLNLGWIFPPARKGAVRAALLRWVCEGEVSRF